MQRTITTVLTLAALASAANAGTVRVHFAPFQSGQGGEYRVVNVAGDAGARGSFSDITSERPWSMGGTNFTDALVGQDDFQSFTTSRAGLIRDNTEFGFSIDAGTRAKNGTGRISDLSNQSAWLFEQFRMGTLGGYSYDGSTTIDGEWNAKSDEERRARAGRTLQTLIWIFEGDIDLKASVPNLGTSMSFLTRVPTGPGSERSNPNALTQSEWDVLRSWHLAAMQAVAGGYQNTSVRVLNLFVDANGNGVYDTGEQAGGSFLTLVVVPMPTGVALTLAGLGLLATRRRRAAK